MNASTDPASAFRAEFPDGPANTTPANMADLLSRMDPAKLEEARRPLTEEAPLDDPRAEVERLRAERDAWRGAVKKCIDSAKPYEDESGVVQITLGDFASLLALLSEVTP